MKLPIPLLNSLQTVQGFNRESFVQVHERGEQVTSVRFNPGKTKHLVSDTQPNIQAARETFITSLPITEKVPWSADGYYLSERPSFILDPFLHAGWYYVQEASGMFLEQALRQTTDLSQPLRVLDLCAAPGGKSTLLQSLISSDSLLVSNEVIKSRASILEENVTKWGGPNVIVTNNDPADFAQLENFFDVIVIDAPCSGSGLFRRDPEAIQEWSEQHVQLCCQRQHRILADVYPALKQGGVLIYSTCSYSAAEDEDVLDWICDEFSMTSLPLQTDNEWHIVPVESARHKAAGYRFFPDKLKGEGFFIACMRKEDGASASLRPPKKLLLQKSSKIETAIVQSWLKTGLPLRLWKQGDRLLAFPSILESELLSVVGKLYVRSAGISIGKIAVTDLIPDHSLAVSTIVSDEIVSVSLKRPEALQYLRKEEVSVESLQKGWALVRYEGARLGWVKMLANRVNNYYPSSWRILKGH